MGRRIHCLAVPSAGANAARFDAFAVEPLGKRYSPQGLALAAGLPSSVQAVKNSAGKGGGYGEA